MTRGYERAHPYYEEPCRFYTCWLREQAFEDGLRKGGDNRDRGQLLAAPSQSRDRSSSSASSRAAPDRVVRHPRRLFATRWPQVKVVARHSIALCGLPPLLPVQRMRIDRQPTLEQFKLLHGALPRLVPIRCLPGSGSCRAPFEYPARRRG